MFIKSIINENNSFMPEHLKGDDASHKGQSSTKGNNHSLSFFAGDSNLKQDSIEARKTSAQKNAMKAIIDQHKRELKTDGVVSDLNEKKEALKKDAELATGEIKRLKDLKQDLKKTFDITDDSTEQKDLDLLEKSIFEPEKLTKEESDQLSKLGPLTDYQKEALQYDAMQKIWQQRLENAGNGISNANRSIIGISLAKLKTHPMVDAQKEAAKILEAASKEVIGIVLQQGKENVEEKTDEAKETAEKQKEAQEKQDAGEKKPTEEPAISEEQADQLLMVDDIKRYAVEQNLTDEEIKGIVIDEQA